MIKIHTDKAPAAIGPYSQAIVHGDLVFTSGQIPINPKTGNIEAEGITAQTEQVMQNLHAVLTASGASFESAIKLPAFSRIWQTLLPSTRFMQNTLPKNPRALA